jgi:TolB-like protein/Flp pilus assembly protein TadD
MSLFEELKRRNVFRVGIAYIVASWLLVQIADLALDVIGAEDWVLRSVVMLLALGFIPVIIFAWAFELTPEGIKREAEVNRTESITNVTAKKLDFVTIGLLLAVVAVVAVDRMLPQDLDDKPDKTGSENHFQQNTEQSTTKPDENGSLTATAPEKSIAVLPFVNMSSDPEQEFFSDGISEEILNALARVKDLQVAGRTSSFAFKGQNQDLRQIGETLGVTNILEGSVRKSGNTVRITAQLIRVDNGFHLWSDTYDRELDNVFAIQDEIAQAILEEMKATLLGDEQFVSTHTQTVAYENYLLARQRIYDRTESSLKLAVAALEEAIEADPNYAPALAQLGIAYMLLSEENYGDIPNTEAGAKAKQLIDRALELDPQLADAMAAKGLHASNFELKHDEAIEWLEGALAINPSLANASIWLALTLEIKGQVQEAIRIYEASYQRDPLNTVTRNNLVVDYNNTGQFERSLALIERAKEDIGDNPELLKSEADTRLTQGEFASSVRLAEEAYRARPLNNPGMLVLGFSYLSLLENERALQVNTPRVRIQALHQLGRSEEAIILGYEQAAGGRVWPEFFTVLVENGEYAKLVEFVESRWENLDAFEADYPERDAIGCFLMGFIAQSYGQLGQEAKFDDAMKRFKASLDHQLSQGANNPFFHFSRAVHAMLAGDQESAIELLETVFANGIGLNINDPKAWPVFAPLNGDPRYEQAKKNLMDKINSEREKLGWEPVAA